MKFVYFGYDFMIRAVQRLMDDGHELTGIFTFDCDNVFNFNREVFALAAQLDIPIYTEKPHGELISHFINQGAECFLSAGYLYKIPVPDEHRSYAVNVHPSLLPKGRGIMPTPHIIIGHPEASGFTIHKMTGEYDAGDILYQKYLPLHEHETVEMLSARIAIQVPEALSRVMRDLPRFWEEAKPQDPVQASFFPPPDDAMRLLDWSKPVADIDRTARAFGRYGSLAVIEGLRYIVCAHDVWAEVHDCEPGAKILSLGREMVVAARDGFVCLKEFQKLG